MTTDPAIYNTSAVQGEPSAPIEIDSNPPINLSSIPQNLQKNLIANLTGTMPTPRRQMIEDTGGNWRNTEHFDLETDTDYDKEDKTHRARVYLMERYIHPEDCSYPKVVFSGGWDCCKEEAEAESRVVARLIAQLMVDPTIALISQSDIAKEIASSF